MMLSIYTQIFIIAYCILIQQEGNFLRTEDARQEEIGSRKSELRRQKAFMQKAERGNRERGQTNNNCRGVFLTISVDKSPAFLDKPAPTNY
ncbi:hypothetical protein NIES593_08875 [Hydrococcus rivularis NIES-593]|uniref:Uncharacterized protein n=1 Tax=Hydrococcus rivularis NIES-593 TaxID=1921803 RepID=A0A1U7HJN3_9CYAN|nr:hypothetical protein NIES593_08875 [Hydrococcus rivularis NIES-593]